MLAHNPSLVWEPMLLIKKKTGRFSPLANSIANAIAARTGTAQTDDDLGDTNTGGVNLMP
jgi:hypothetical protein